MTHHHILAEYGFKQDPHKWAFVNSQGIELTGEAVQRILSGLAGERGLRRLLNHLKENDAKAT